MKTYKVTFMKYGKEVYSDVATVAHRHQAMDAVSDVHGDLCRHGQAEAFDYELYKVEEVEIDVCYAPGCKKEHAPGQVLCAEHAAMVSKKDAPTKYLVIGLDFITPYPNFRAANERANRMVKESAPFGIWSCLLQEWAQEPNDKRIAPPSPVATPTEHSPHGRSNMANVEAVQAMAIADIARREAQLTLDKIDVLAGVAVSPFDEAREHAAACLRTAEHLEQLMKEDGEGHFYFAGTLADKSPDLANWTRCNKTTFEANLRDDWPVMTVKPGFAMVTK